MVLARPATTSLFTLALSAALGHGASVPPTRRAPSSGMSMKGTGTGVRQLNLGSYGASSSASSSSASSSQISVSDYQDVIYRVEIELAGNTFTVQMDTGSSDLWIYSPDSKLQLTNKTDIIATETYGIGTAKGPIVFGDFKLGQYEVKNQAFIAATSADGFNFFTEGVVGIMGLAFDDANFSPVNDEMQQAYGTENLLGRTPISNIFFANPKAPNSFDVRLDRTGDLDDTASGTLLVSEHDAAWANVSAQPRLPRVAAGRWSVPLDGMAVNGKTVTFNKSSISTVPEGKIAALLDTGFTFPPIPPAAVDAIYSSIEGAVKIGDDAPQWIVPCDGATNVTFTFGGKPFPVHPLDLTFVATTEVPSGTNGKTENVTYCYNTYQYLALDPNSFSGFDAILGDAFLRNAYASFDYGETDSSGNSSYVQLVPTTDAEFAWYDFSVSRAKALKQLPPTMDPAALVKLASQSDDGSAASGAVESTPGSGSSDQLYGLVDKYGPVIIGLLAGNILVGVLLCIIGLAACLRGHVRAGATRSVNSSYAPVRVKEAEAMGYADRDAYHD